MDLGRRFDDLFEQILATQLFDRYQQIGAEVRTVACDDVALMTAGFHEGLHAGHEPFHSAPQRPT